MIASELSDALEGGATREHGDDRQAENGREIVPATFGFSRIESAIGHFDERQWQGLTSREASTYPNSQFSPTSNTE